MTPFVEMSQLVAADVIEPWDNYMPKDVMDDILPPIREECSLNGKMYTWPFLLDITGMGVSTDLTSKAGANDLPTIWDDYLVNGKKITDSKVAPYGVTFDAHGWRGVARLQLTDPGLFYWDERGNHVPDVAYEPRLRYTVGGVREELSYFTSCVRDGRPAALVSKEDVVHGIEVAAAAQQACRTGQAEQVPAYA
jgi:ABC-type glycerol-3-phosphate transport system substrate-binding protein